MHTRHANKSIFTVYVRNGKDWVYEGTYSTASEAATIARHYHDQTYQVQIDSSEVPVQRDHMD